MQREQVASLGEGTNLDPLKTSDVRQSHVINRAKAEPVFGRERP